MFLLISNLSRHRRISEGIRKRKLPINSGSFFIRSSDLARNVEGGATSGPFSRFPSRSRCHHQLRPGQDAEGEARADAPAAASAARGNVLPSPPLALADVLPLEVLTTALAPIRSTESFPAPAFLRPSSSRATSTRRPPARWSARVSSCTSERTRSIARPRPDNGPGTTATMVVARARCSSPDAMRPVNWSAPTERGSPRSN